MPNSSSLQQEVISAWQTESLRSTAFPSSVVRIDNVNWWQELIGEPPENRVIRAREGVQQDEGRFENGRLVLGVRPTRFDWLYTVGTDTEPTQQWVGPFDDSINLFLDLMSRWFDVCPPSKRLALGIVLTLPVPDRVAGYQILSEYLPHIKFDSEGSSDFLYQINRPRKSQIDIPGLRINRLSKWAVARHGQGNIEISPDIQASFVPTSESFACRLEMDINTVPEPQVEIPKSKYMDVFREFVDLAKEILSRGDVP